MTTKTAKLSRLAAPKKATRGNLKPAEIRPLVMAARKAFDLQKKWGNIDALVTFDTWRREQCLEAVSQPGITACSHEDYRPLLAHFQVLSGDDSAAFSSAMAGGKSSDYAASGDTREERRHTAHLIADLLAAHDFRATAPVADLCESDSLRRLAIDAKGKAPIGVGYLIWLVRGKTQRPTLTLGADWLSGLAERCTANQLRQIFHTLTNRINSLEGIGSAKTRNKSQRSGSDQGTT